MPGQGLVRSDGTYDPLEDGRIGATDIVRNVVGQNKALDLTGSTWNQFWANLDKQGGFISSVVNYIPGINATGVLHDTWWNPVNGKPGSMFGFGFNAVTNWGTMLPAAAVAYGALLNDPYARQSIMIDRIRK